MQQRHISAPGDGADRSGDCGRRVSLPSRGSGAQTGASGGTEGTAGEGQQGSLEHTAARGPRQQSSLECARASGLGVDASTGLPHRDFARGVNAGGSSSRRRTGQSDSNAHIDGSNRRQSDSELRLGAGSDGPRQHNESRMKEEHEAFILRRRLQVCVLDGPFWGCRIAVLPQDSP